MPLVDAHPRSVSGRRGVAKFDPSWGISAIYRKRESDGLWLRTRDGDPAFMIPLRHHYSGAGGGKVGLPPGYKLALVTPDGMAIAGFTRQKFRADDQEGVCMNVFARWGGDHLASELIRDACRVSENTFGPLRVFTFVDPTAIRSTNPGYCYKVAGWRQCGVSSKKLLIFDYEP